MSIKKIAEKAGVSPATVSRVLNNPNYKCSVSGLRDKIWKTAIEMKKSETGRFCKTGENMVYQYSDDKNRFLTDRSFFFGAAAGN